MHRIVVLVIVSILSGCAGLQPRAPLPVQIALAPGGETLLDRLLAPEEARHPGQSAFRLVSEGPEAFVLRARSAVAAARSLDVQTYIWHDDLTGRVLAYRLLEAADRGVQVRLLVDDMNARGNHYSFAALDAHPDIEVRLFNPLQSRVGMLRFAVEAVVDFRRINRRMHNKSWIADNRLALVGGRNLGDEYFGASDAVNFVDLDFVMIGPVVRDVSAAFDTYWNSTTAYPVHLLAPQDVTSEALAALRARIAPTMDEANASRYADALRGDETLLKMAAGEWPVHWTSRYRFVADDPRKAMGKGEEGSQVLALLGPMVEAARERVNIISPYFVPGEQGTAGLAELVASGRQVNVLTNSLAANDVAAVYGGYSRWRKALLRNGVNVWELKPLPGSRRESSLLGSSGASLHTKALTVDGRWAFVGSYNLDPRSTSLNSEQGVFVEDIDIAVQLDELFKIETLGARAWAVTLKDDRLRWSDGSVVHESAPEASFGRKVQAWLARMLRIDAQL